MAALRPGRPTVLQGLRSTTQVADGCTTASRGQIGEWGGLPSPAVMWTVVDI